jgi:serine/threonine protein kinase/tetratricopeptide (TPR) repeat protein
MITLGPFRLEAPIGRGGAGVVWRGSHVASGRPVAVKVLLTEAARRPDALAVFRREVRSVAGLDHPGIVRIYEHGVAPDAVEAESDAQIVAGSPWLAMELASATLGESPPDGWAELLPALRALLRALGHAHARGVVHRDVKPSNVLVGAGGLRLTDFGLAALDEEAPTAVGGTPRYMAPEQFVRGGPDHGPWTDLYSFGCVAWHLASGLPPFEMTDLNALAWAQQHQPPPALQPRRPVPEGFEAWLRRLLEKEPGQRFQRAADALWSLDRLGKPGQVQRTRTFSHRSEPTVTITDPDLLPEAKPARSAVPPAPVEAPPVPVTWRWALPEIPPPTLSDAGIGLWGLRAIPFVGREKERDELWARLVEVYAARRPRLVALQGAAGHGKSRLAQWLGERAHELGAGEVLVARHGPLGGPGDGLARLVARRYGVVNVPAERIPARLARLAELSDRGERDQVVSLVLGERFETPEERWVVVERVLLRAAEWRPAVVWLDDVQWGADALRFAAWLLRRSPRAPLLLVLTAQEEALAEQPETSALLDRVLGLPGAERLRVAPLDGIASNALLRQLLPLDASLAATVAERTGGNPLFVVQLVGDWVHRDALQPGAGGFALRDADAAGLPDDLHTVWARRLDRIYEQTPDLRGPIELAAALGQEVDRGEWRRACERHGLPWSDRRADAWIDRLADERLARRTEGGFAFAHGMLRESVQRLAAEGGRAAAQHRACAAALPADATHAERRGLHLLLGGDARAALPDLLEGVRMRRRDADYRASLAVVARWEEAARQVGLPLDDPMHVQARIEKGIALQGLRRLTEAEAAYAGALELALAQGDQEQASEAQIHLGETDLMRGELDLAAAHYDEALAIAKAMGNELHVGNVIREIGRLALRRGELDRAEAMLEEARKYDDLSLKGLGRRLSALADLSVQRRDLDAAARYFEQCIEVSDRMKSRSGRRRGLEGLADVARLQGRLDEAEARMREVLALSEALGREPNLARLNLALVLIGRGRHEEARRELEALRPALERDKARGYLAFVAVSLLPVHAHLGDWPAFDDDLVLARDLLAQTRMVDADAGYCAERAGDEAARAGQPDRATAAWRLALDQWTTLGSAEKVAEITAKLG